MPKHSFKLVLLLLGACGQNVLLPPTCCCKISNFLNKGSRCLTQFGLQSSKKGQIGGPTRSHCGSVFSANHLHLTSGAERWALCSSVLLLDVHGRGQTFHPSHLGYLSSHTSQLLPLQFECSSYVCVPLAALRDQSNACFPPIWIPLTGLVLLCSLLSSAAPCWRQVLATLNARLLYIYHPKDYF